VIVDSGAFIRNAPVKDIGKNAYTISDVVSEIRDKATRQRLQVLPYKLNLKEPSAESIRVVTLFTKKTGDYPNLSAPDIRLIALTYQLEKQHVGSEHIKAVPDKKPLQFQVGSDSTGTEIAGFYLEKDKQKKSKDNDKSDVTNSDSNVQGTDSVESENEVQNLKSDPESNTESSVEVVGGEITAGGDASLNGTDKDSTETLAEQVSDIKIDAVSKKSVYFADGDTIRGDVIVEGDADSESEEEDSEDDEDEEGWITPGNVDEMNQMMTGSVPGDVQEMCKVACLTTDFAMQNVLIQMGLNVMSVDGMLIKKAKSFVLRCFTCFKITTNMDKKFCHHCGNDTLRKLSVSINEDGTMKYYLSKRRPKLYKKEYLPLPRGGKHSNYPKLTEDQRLPQRRKAKMKEQHYGVFDVDYIANSSPFALRDTHSRSALLGVGRNFNKRNGGDNVRKRKK